MSVEALISTQVIDTTSVGRSVMTAADAAAVRTAADAQVTLVSGTNIKTVNSTSLLGSGNIAVSASPAGSTKQVQFNSTGVFAGATGFEYQSGVSPNVLVTSQAATYVGLRIAEAASPTVSPLQFRTSAGVETFAVAAGGRAFSFFNNNSYYSYIAQIEGTFGDRPTLAFATNNITAATRPTSYQMTINGVGDGSAKSLLCLGTGTYSGTVQTMASASPGIGAVRGCAGSGTNIAGAALEIAAGPSTGSATPALLKLQSTTAGASGTTQQTLRDCIQVDGNTTAAETPMLLLDITAGTLKRVSIGAADSGGVGFKVLRVPN